MRHAIAVSLAALVMLSAAACSGGDRQAAVRLDGSPRFPDDEGVATSLDFEEMTLDGSRKYRVSDNLRAFSTYDGELEPMLTRRNQYVQVGLEDDTVVWMAGIAEVVRLDPPAVFYVGDLLQVDRRRRAIFRDGTVLRVAEGVVPPPNPMRVQVRIDPARHHVVRFTPAGS